MPFGSIADAKIHKKNGLEIFFFAPSGHSKDQQYYFQSFVGENVVFVERYEPVGRTGIGTMKKGDAWQSFPLWV